MSQLLIAFGVIWSYLAHCLLFFDFLAVDSFCVYFHCLLLVLFCAVPFLGFALVKRRRHGLKFGPGQASALQEGTMTALMIARFSRKGLTWRFTMTTFSSVDPIS